MKTVADVRSSIHKRTLQFRAMDRLVNSVAFHQAFAIDPDNTFLRFALLSGNTQEVEDWIDRTLTRKLEIAEMSLRELRSLASRVGILFYTSYNKDELIIAITQKQNHDRSSSNAAG